METVVILVLSLSLAVRYIKVSQIELQNTNCYKLVRVSQWKENHYG